MNKKALVAFLTTISILLSSASPAMAKSFNSKTNISLNHPWTVSFNQKINLNEAFEGVYIKESNGSRLPTRITFDDSHTKMIITPTDGYKPSTTYTLNVDGVCNEDGKAIIDPTTMDFTTTNETQYGSFDINTVYANGSVHNTLSNVNPDCIFDLELSKNIDTSTLNNVTVTDMDGNKANVKVTVMGSEIDIAPNNVFWDDTNTVNVPRNTYNCNTVYCINLNGVKSVDGQNLRTKTYNFTTRNYQLNPTIHYICNDDYISFGNQYAKDLWAIPNATNGSLQKCHDDNGTLVFENEDPLKQVNQITDDWNKYANKQNRNIVDLQVELRKQYQRILAENPDYAGYNVGFLGCAPMISHSIAGQTIDTTGRAEYDFTPTLNASTPEDAFKLYSFYNQNTAITFPNTGDLNTIFTRVNPQVAIVINDMDSNNAKANLSKLALYQSLYCMFGGDIATDAYSYILSEKNDTTTSGQLHAKTLGPVTIYSENNTFLFKY